MYTQLNFVPYPQDQQSVFQQAKWLLHELIKEKNHKHPCDCGACIYAAYKKMNKAKNRPYSKRTFFVYFLRDAFFWITYYEGTKINFYEVAKSYRINIRNDILSTEILWGNLRSSNKLKRINVEYPSISSPKLKTLHILLELETKENNQKAKKFLQGILNKKSFYTYYKRAGDPKLDKLVKKIRNDLPFKKSPRII
jgi:hypothetical protein